MGGEREREHILRCIDRLCEDARLLYLPTRQVEVLEIPPSPLEFYREYVSQNRPVVVRNAINHWPALEKWNMEYLKRKIGGNSVTVALTPNGYADAVIEEEERGVKEKGEKKEKTKCFVLPEERCVRVEQVLDYLCEEEEQKGRETREGGGDRPVYYVQHQNGNFCTEFSSLSGDIDEGGVGFAREAFGGGKEDGQGHALDAINMWIGSSRAVSSMHKDPYENIYCVVSGEKTFTLIPPNEIAYLHYEMCAVEKYTYPEHEEFPTSNKGVTRVPVEGMEPIPWIPLDPDDPDYEQYPEFRKAHPISCTIGKGDLLYLPALWFHKVAQHGSPVIAVNYWYDMVCDMKYTQLELLKNLMCIP
eukprot:Nk52_evm39s1705 gene=Nk52_evmTU39s1705